MTPELAEKKRKFPGLCIPDHLKKEEEEEDKTTEGERSTASQAMNEVKLYFFIITHLIVNLKLVILTV